MFTAKAAKFHLDLTDSIPHTEVEVRLVDDVHQSALRLSPSCGCHGVVRPQHCHLHTHNMLQLESFGEIKNKVKVHSPLKTVQEVQVLQVVPAAQEY